MSITTKKLLLAALAVATVAGIGFSQPAAADPHHPVGHDREWRAHEYEAHRWHHYHPIPAPDVVYAPPPVVYSQPEPTPGINLVVPLHFH